MRAGATMVAKTRAPDTEAVKAMVSGRHNDPFSILGPHAQRDDSMGISIFAPDADTVEVVDPASGTIIVALEKFDAEGFFFGTTDRHFPSYRLRKRRGPHTWEKASSMSSNSRSSYAFSKGPRRATAITASQSQKWTQ